MSQIAPKLVSRLGTQPTVLAEVCKFLSVSQGAFISVTLNHTLPHLFADRDHRTLEAIGNELREKPSLLFINYAPTILAHAFLLPPGQTNAVLSFVVHVLRETSGASSIDIPSVVRSCIMNLLAELVIVMGQEDDYAVARVCGPFLSLKAETDRAHTGNSSIAEGHRHHSYNSDAVQRTLVT